MGRIAEIVVFIALVATVVFLAVVVWDVKDQIAQLSKQEQARVEYIPASEDVGGTVIVDTNKEDINALKQYFDTAISTLSGTTQTVIRETKETVSSAPQTSYVPMGSTATTTSTDWIDVADSKVYIDLENDYGSGALVTWEVALKVDHANGTAYARLFDETNGIAVQGSQIEVVDSDTLVLKSSSYLPFWRGRNLYKVQIKSLNSFLVTYSSGKIKIQH